LEILFSYCYFVNFSKRKPIPLQLDHQVTPAASKPVKVSVTMAKGMIDGKESIIKQKTEYAPAFHGWHHSSSMIPNSSAIMAFSNASSLVS
jgi:hypothetical protein